MNLVAALPAALAAPFLLLVPGLVLLLLLPERERCALEPDEALFLAVATSLGLSSWLGLLLAELGRFSMLTAGAALAVLSGLAALAGRRRLGWPWRRPVRAGALAPACLVLALAVALQARPSQYIVGGRDPGAYVASMALIARTGGIQFTDPAVLAIPGEDVELFFRNPERPDFSFARLMGFDLERPETGRVVPQFFHLFPAFGSYLFQAMGIKGALAAPPLLGILGTLAVLLALRRLFSAPVALLAALLLSLNVVQVWFSRYPVSEPFSQLLLFLALLALWHWEERGSPVFGAMAGGALGLSLLVRVDSVLVVLPIGLYVLARRAGGAGWRSLAPFLGGFALLAAHAALHAALFASKYVLDIAARPYWRQPASLWVALGLLAALALVASGPLGGRLREAARPRARGLRAAAAGALGALALYAYFLRPLLSAWAGADGNPAEAAWADRSALVALGFHRLAAHDAQSFLRLGWFVTPLGLLLGVLGLIAAIRDYRPRSLFPLLLALTFAGFYFYKIRVWNDYYFALRRFVPVVLPFLLGFAALALVRLAGRGGWRRAAAGALALGLATSYALETRRIARHVDWKGSVDFVREIARRFTRDDVVVFEQPRSIHLLSLPLWSAHGVNVLELARFNPDPERLRHLLLGWRARFRNIYFVHTYSTDLCGLFLQRVGDHGFQTLEWERSYDRPPRRPETRALYFTVSRVLLPEELQVPALDEVDVGGSDDFQVSGFFDKEGGGERSYRWTGRCGSLFLPGARPGATLELVASIGRRPDQPEVRVSLSGLELGRFTPGSGWDAHPFRLPDPLPPGPPVLRLDVKAYRPKNVDPRSEDTRDLGVMVDRVRIVARAILRAPVPGGAR